MALLDLITRFRNFLNRMFWREQFVGTALSEREQELSDAWHARNLSFLAHIAAWLNVLLINRGWEPWKSVAFAAWCGVLMFAVFEVARHARKRA